MVTMSVRNENIIHITKIYTQQLCILDKQVTCSSIKQNPMLFCFQQD